MTGRNGPGPSIEVRGGAGGVSARLEDLDRVAGLLEGVAGELEDRAAEVVRCGADPALVASAVLSPVSFARAQRAVADAVAGRHGLAPLAASVRALALAVRAAVLAYRGADAAAEGAVRGVELGVGVGLGLAVDAGAAASMLGAAALVGSGGAPSVLLVAGPASVVLRPALAGIVAGGADALTRTPWVAERLVGLVPGAVVGVSLGGPPLPGIPAAGRVLRARVPVAGAAGVVAGSGHWVCEPGGLSLRPTASGPVSVAPTAGSLLALVPDDPAGPTVRVVGVQGPRGRAWVVAIPGTRSWGLPAGRQPLDAVANLRLVAGLATASRDAVLEATREAGVVPGQPVVLVGHSQGGIVAASLASDPAVRPLLTVTHVVTAGSPLGTFAVPDDVSVLSLEHRRDVVPRLDGGGNPDRPSWWTVRADPVTGRAGTEEVLAQHALAGYRGTAEAIDSSGDPSLEVWRDGLRQVLGEGGPGAVTDVVAERGQGPCRP